MNTIHFYIILKQLIRFFFLQFRLNTIHFYIILKPMATSSFLGISLNTIHFYIILKPVCIYLLKNRKFEYHTFLHHSQTVAWCNPSLCSLNTIHFYIILKRSGGQAVRGRGLNTIHFYIILKRQHPEKLLQ